MGGFFGVVSKKDAVSDVFFGTDYHSHLGTYRGGMAAFCKEVGLQREIHNIQNSPFRTKFEHVFEEMKGNCAIGCISDTDPQPLLIRSKLGTYAIILLGAISNAEELIKTHLKDEGSQFLVMTGGRVNNTELIAALINKKDSFEEGIRFAQTTIEGSATILIMKDDGKIIASRDFYGRTPVHIGKNDDGFAVSFESFALEKLDFEVYSELGPGEIVELSESEYKVLMKPEKEMKICSFLWTYYGYPTSTYEGINVETMRYKNGCVMARNDKANENYGDLDYVCGVPDSGTPHAIGYANESKIPFARPFIKYTPTWSRSFLPANQKERVKVAKMKQMPVHELIEDKNLLFIDDSIVRGTQIKETVDFLYDNGAKKVHMRSACPPIMYGCKYLNFSRATSDMELIARRVIMDIEGAEGFKHLDEYSDEKTQRGKNLRKAISDKFDFETLEFQTVEGVIEAIGLDPCKLCTYCWNGKE